MTPAIELIGLQKSFGTRHAVRDLNLQVPRGALYGIIGPNGAGKSTSLRMLLSILFPDRGEVRVLGFDSALKAKDRIGYLPEERGVYRKMKVADFLLHMGVLKSLPRAEAARRAQAWLERVELPDVAKKRCEELSKGMQQKIQFIAAVLHEPELLILDEPFSGLDPVNMRLLKRLIEAEHARGCTVLFSTHVMPQAETMCEHIVMIHQGRKVLDDTLAGIRAGHRPNAVELEPLDASAPIPETVHGLPGITGISAQEVGYRIGLDADAELPRLMADLARTWPPARLAIVRPSLEDIFIDIVARTSEEGLPA
ncbi:ABC transporter ATP-binding protein [Aquimonas voraii]|uniref:ABC-2 type transport system ATP-binding protein n=1 Tax=Aquimonas voraii TaxID=265719 RepID=A0A1G6WUK4_9GAMM|nr:ATP-binding cassette domain-containing protein [Aquimonas voraii]SDD69469.1 ABC-2 type transport system ATP-binding protein [Aquimonas voraii]